MAMSQGQLTLLVFAASLLVWAESAPNAGYVPPPLYERDALFTPISSNYDFIVVGGGATGCAIASTLAETYRVLVLEKGGAQEEYPDTLTAGAFPNSAAGNAVERFRTLDGSWAVRAQVLGGGTTVNAGILGDAEDDFIRTLGLDLTKAKEAYRWATDKVATFPGSKNFVLTDPFRDSLKEVGFNPELGNVWEHKNGIRDSGALFDDMGKRHSAAEFVRRPNLKLTVYLRALTRKILFTTPRGSTRPKAIGVSFTDKWGFMHQALGKVIVSAGAVASPQLLILSGIGPAAELSRLRIAPLVVLPVGQNVGDEPAFQAIMPSKIPYLPNAFNNMKRYHGINSYSNILNGGGQPQTIGSILVGQINTLPPAKRDALTYNALRVLVSGTALISPSFKYELNNNYVLLGALYRPKSRGYLTLQNTNAATTPNVLINYLKDPNDAQRAANLTRVMRRMVNSNALAKFRSSKVPLSWKIAGLTGGLPELAFTLPGFFEGAIPPYPRTNDEWAMQQFAKNTFVTSYHLFGGCTVGAVVDYNFTVKGVDDLWVADASVFPESPGTNPSNTCMMFGRYVGNKIRGIY